MKHLTKLSLLLVIALSLGLWSCNKDTVDPLIQGLAIEDFDLIQVTNEDPFVKLTISASDDNEIKEITTKIFTVDGTEPIASNVLRQIINNEINRITLRLPFPNREIAPSGRYRVEYTITDEKDNRTVNELTINILNYITEAASACEFPNLPLPEGKNTWVRVIAPSNTGDDPVHIVGDFMEANGADGNWNPGNPEFAMTRVEGTNCYYIALNLTPGQQIKFTRGGWDRVMKDENGRDFRTQSDEPRPGFNGDGNIQWGTAPFEPVSVFTFTVPNWADRVVPAPSIIPSAAIQTGKITTVVDINTTNDDAQYYLVPKGATDLSNAVQMVRVPGSTQMAAAVNKVAGAEYVIVKDEAEKTGVNSFGFDVIITIDGQINPQNAGIAGFKTEFNPPREVTQLLLVGGATPAGWDNSAGNTQLLTETAPGKYSITTTFSNGNGGYLLISDIGNWGDDSKIGKFSGNFFGGTLGFAGGDFDAPGDNPVGTYLLEVDLTTASYKLTPQ